MGGVGFATAALAITGASVLLTGRSADRAFELAVPGAAAAMLILGIVDDRFQLSPLAKLVSSLIVGALTVFVITESLGRSLPWPVTLLAVVWFGGVVHALNLLDNMDGLAGGVALIAIAFLAWLFARTFGPFVGLFLDSRRGKPRRVSVLEPETRATLHGRFRQPVSWRNPGGGLARGHGRPAH